MLAKASKHWLVALLSLTLLLGAAIGVLIDQHLLSPAEAVPVLAIRTGRSRWPHPGGPPSKDRRIYWLTQQLHLTDSQQAALGALLEKHQAVEADFHARRRDEFQQMQDRFMNEIEMELDGSQIEQLREMRRQMELRREMDMLRPKHRGGPGGPWNPGAKPPTSSTPEHRGFPGGPERNPEGAQRP